MNRFFLLLVLVSWLLSACKKEPIVPNKNQNLPIDSTTLDSNTTVPIILHPSDSMLLPHIVGSQWLYTGYSISNQGGVLIPDTVHYNCTDSSLASDGLYYYRFTSTPYHYYHNGFRSHKSSLDNNVYTTWHLDDYPQPYLHNIPTVGDSWSFNIYNVSHEYSILSTDTSISVPAGHFREVTVVKYKKINNPFGGHYGNKYTSQQYYKRGVGIIKMTIIETDYNFMDSTTTELELDSYYIP